MLQKQMNNAFLPTRHGMFHPVPCVAAAETLASHFPQPRRKPLSGDVWLTMFSTQGEAFPKSLTALLKLKGARAMCQEHGAKDLALYFISSRGQIRLVQNETTKEWRRGLLNGLGPWSPPWLPPSLLVSFFPELCPYLFRTPRRHRHGHSRKSGLATGDNQPGPQDCCCP